MEFGDWRVFELDQENIKVMDAVDMEIDVPLEREDLSSNNDGVSAVERVAKRPRLSANENEENDVGSPQESSTAFELPPEVWARVMERKYYIVYV